MNTDRRRKRLLAAGVVLMLVALFSYVATLDDSDPEALPGTEEAMDPGLP